MKSSKISWSKPKSKPNSDFKEFNKKCAQHGLKLRRHPSGYFYFIGLTEDIQRKIWESDKNFSVYVYAFADQTLAQWDDELTGIVTALSL